MIKPMTRKTEQLSTFNALTRGIGESQDIESLYGEVTNTAMNETNI